MARGAGKNNWALFLLLLAGIVLGSFIAQATSGISALSWLNYGQKFGLTSPFTLSPLGNRSISTNNSIVI